MISAAKFTLELTKYSRKSSVNKQNNRKLYFHQSMTYLSLLQDTKFQQLKFIGFKEKLAKSGKLVGSGGGRGGEKCPLN